VLAIVAGHTAPEGGQRQILYDLAKTSLPEFISDPRDGSCQGIANAAIRVQIETSQNRKLSILHQSVVANPVFNVGTAVDGRIVDNQLSKG
jgi:hypothetical protein